MQQQATPKLVRPFAGATIDYPQGNGREIIYCRQRVQDGDPEIARLGVQPGERFWLVRVGNWQCPTRYCAVYERAGQYSSSMRYDTFTHRQVIEKVKAHRAALAEAKRVREAFAHPETLKVEYSTYEIMHAAYGWYPVYRVNGGPWREFIEASEKVSFMFESMAEAYLTWQSVEIVRRQALGE